MITKRKTICQNKISLSIFRKRLNVEYVQQYIMGLIWVL